MDTHCVLVRVERHDIGLLCSLMAGYEGVAIVRTVDPKQGLVALLVAPCVLYDSSGHRTGPFPGNASVPSQDRGRRHAESVMPGAGPHTVSRDTRD